MAEKKVSGKAKKPNIKKDSSYDDFLAQHGAELRKRTTRSVAEPVRKQDNTPPTESRCGEIDPHTTVNPATDHQIFKKRSGRILSDDSGFKAKSYNQRFELTPEMPELRDTTEQEDVITSSIQGQQTMADMMSDNTEEDISVPIEGQIINDEQDPFTAAYQAFRNSAPPTFGKSEKLRAIARTAAEDAGMEPESQITFPAFDPLFRIPEEKKDKKKFRIKKKDKNEKQSFDIDEKDIVTKAIQEETEPETPGNEPAETAIKEEKRNRFFDFLADEQGAQETDAPFEIDSKNDVRSVLKTLTEHSRTALIKSGILAILGIILAIILFALDNSNAAAHSLLSLIFLLAGSAVCIKDIAEGIKDIAKKKITLNSGVMLICFSALLQTLLSFLFPSSIADGINILAPAALFSMTAVTIPKFLLSNNSKLTAGMFASGSVSVFRTASDGGIDGVISEKITGGKGQLRYSANAQFATGLMRKLTNAVPKPFGLNAAYIMLTAFSLIAGLASGFISADAMSGITTFTAMIISCIPVSYTLTAALLLYNTNSTLAKNKSSLISYRCATSLTETKAVVFSTSDITEKSACSIHGVKAFGHTDPQKATLYCAAAINAGMSPLSEIMKQVTDQSENDVPDAHNLEISSHKGIKATVENSTVFLGSRSFLEENGIYIPDDNYEEKFLTGDRKLLYFAMDGRFTMLLIVSYHIRRNVAAFFKYLTANDIKIVIHSSDPNITAAYIAKKCKIPEDSVIETDDAEASYFTDKSSRTESALPADVFTDGSITALSGLVRNAFSLNKIINILPFVIYILSAICAILIIAPAFLGSVAAIGNAYIIIMRVASFALSFAALKFLSK